MSRTKLALGLEYPLGLGGGVSVLVRELIRGLKEQFAIVLVSPDSSTDQVLEEAGIREHIFWNPETPTHASSYALVQELVRRRVGIAHLHSGGTYGWGIRRLDTSPFSGLKRAGISCVSTVHTAVGLMEGYCDTRRPRWFKLGLLPPAWLAKLHALQGVSAEITVSRSDLEKVRRWYWPARRKFRYIYHSRLQEENAAKKTEQEREPTILAVGHLARRKGQPLLARAFSQIAAAYPQWNLQIAGGVVEPGARDEIEKLITDHGLSGRIQLLGERRDIPEMMRRASVFAQASYFEGLPLALQEALFAGCACVATRIDGHTELIENERTGLLVAPGNEAALAAALKRIMDDVGLRRSLADAAPASILAKGMTAGQMVASHTVLYRQLLDGPQHSV